MSRVAGVDADERPICIRQLTVDEGIRTSPVLPNERNSTQGTAALQDFDPAYVGDGLQKSICRDSIITKKPPAGTAWQRQGDLQLRLFSRDAAEAYGAGQGDDIDLSPFFHPPMSRVPG